MSLFSYSFDKDPVSTFIGFDEHDNKLKAISKFINESQDTDFPLYSLNKLDENTYVLYMDIARI